MPPTSALRFHLLGGDGDDQLALIVDEVFGSSTLLDLFLDGGRGVDRARVTRNVTVKNCEQVEFVK